MSVFSFLWGGSSSTGDNEIPSIYPLAVAQNVFITSDVQFTFRKILVDVFERTYGLDSEYNRFLWDNCLQNESNKGLVTLLSEAMAKRSDLFLVFKRDVLREADHSEREEIRKDYKERAESKVGVFISFKNYRQSEMVEIYSGFEYCVWMALNKSLNLAKAIQLKMSDLRASVSLSDSEVAKSQARSIATALGKGNDVLLDAKDLIDSAKVDVEPTEKAIAFLTGKKAFVLGFPVSYFEGELTTGIGTTGEADTKAVERGLKPYFVSIVQPTVEALFGKKVSFKTQDFRQLSSGLEALRTFELTSDEMLSREAKTDLIGRIFELDPKEEAKALKAEAKDREENPEEPEEGEEEENNQAPPGQRRRFE